MSLVPEVFALALVAIVEFVIIGFLYRRLTQARREIGELQSARREDSIDPEQAPNER